MKNRDQQLDAIRETYRRYRADGRSRLWDLSNAGYARIASDRDAALVDLLRRSLPGAGGRVLDLGCGDGRLARKARDAGVAFASWTGVDLDPEWVVQARTSVPWAEFIEASADQLRFDDGSFDVVVASTLFSSLPSPRFEQAVASEVRRVLRPCGWLVWYDLRYASPTNRAVHSISARRLRKLFPDWHLDLRTMTLLPPLARRLRGLTAVMYRPLERVPFLQSHHVGRLLRPCETDLRQHRRVE